MESQQYQLVKSGFRGAIILEGIQNSRGGAATDDQIMWCTFYLRQVKKIVYYFL